MNKRRSVSIYVRGEDRTAQITDWKITKSEGQEVLKLTCYFRSKKTYSFPLAECRILPTRELGDVLLKKHNSAIVKPIKRAIIYGERYAVVCFADDAKSYIYKFEDIKLVAQTAIKDTSVFRYFVDVAKNREKSAGAEAQRLIAGNVVRQLERLPNCSSTALHAYCLGQNGTQAPGEGLIYPFGVNESQLAAVEQAFNAQISVIEGPPGTGKTQTILNILANILLRGKTVAVLSNNNAAVENVYEKLEKSGLGHLVAKLGSTENRKNFFANPPSWPSTEPEAAPSMVDIQSILGELKRHLRNNRQVAELQAEIDELNIERRYLQQWREDNGVIVPAPLDKYGLSPRKTADLMAYLSHLGERRVQIRDRLELLFNFKIFRIKPFAKGDDRISFFYNLQMHFYDVALTEKEAALQACRESLQRGNFTDLLEKLTKSSMRYLKRHLYIQDRALDSFDANTYRNCFDDFTRRFPILGSSTHSIVNSIAQGAILDYVIIDEASQQDIVPGILALGCAENLIVVGDSRQLAHIPVALGLLPPNDVYDCERYSLLDSCIGVFMDSLPRSLLKEHYRCHPRIIQFCNQQFYNKALIPMTQDKGESPLRLILTAKGNHTRGNSNLRELDSLRKVLDNAGEPIELSKDGQGFISPFRAQVTLSGACLPANFVKDTLHKFQGRECDEIVFSTVLDKKRRNQLRLDFVDDPRMINVAVSRAKSRFTLVTGDNVFTEQNSHLAALVRYIKYYARDEHLVCAPVVSAFDLLYREYDQSLERLHARLRPEDSRFKSEQIVAYLLREILIKAPYQALTYYTQVKLNQVVSSTSSVLEKDELKFLSNGASCDFVLNFKVGKNPLGVIEVDGGTHDRAEQARRDALKNSILEKNNIPILRLRTVESHIEEKIERFLARCANAVTDT